MGLDMYLYGVITAYNMFEYNIGEIKIYIEMGYWRKANQIHNWFVKNVQNNIDNCAEYYVSREKLIELNNICENVLDNHELAEELLPVKKGFFFGSTEYDEYYYDELEETMEIIEKALKSEASYFKYHSSW